MKKIIFILILGLVVICSIYNNSKSYFEYAKENGLTPNSSCIGEYTKIPKKNPTQVGVHIIHFNISDKKTQKPWKLTHSFEAKSLILFLGPLKMLP